MPCIRRRGEGIAVMRRCIPSPASSWILAYNFAHVPRSVEGDPAQTCQGKERGAPFRYARHALAHRTVLHCGSLGAGKRRPSAVRKSSRPLLAGTARLTIVSLWSLPNRPGKSGVVGLHRSATGTGRWGHRNYRGLVGVQESLMSDMRASGANRTNAFGPDFHCQSAGQWRIRRADETLCETIGRHRPSPASRRSRRPGAQPRALRPHRPPPMCAATGRKELRNPRPQAEARLSERSVPARRRSRRTVFACARTDGAPRLSLSEMVSAYSSRITAYCFAKSGSRASASSTRRVSRALSVPAACHGSSASTSPGASSVILLLFAVMANLVRCRLPSADRPVSCAHRTVAS